MQTALIAKGSRCKRGSLQAIFITVLNAACIVNCMVGDHWSPGRMPMNIDHLIPPLLYALESGVSIMQQEEQTLSCISACNSMPGNEISATIQLWVQVWVQTLGLRFEAQNKFWTIRITETLNRNLEGASTSRLYLCGLGTGSIWREPSQNRTTSLSNMFIPIFY